MRFSDQVEIEEGRTYCATGDDTSAYANQKDMTRRCCVAILS